ncbi:MAG: L,D-transpeptidase [Roseiarcus sp.]|jgi:lipoprotein-anchoring transpeptidase ErfK/SrfK
MRRVSDFLVLALFSVSALAIGAGGAWAATADSLVIPGIGPPAAAPQRTGGGLGGGFIEFILTGQAGGTRPAPQAFAASQPPAKQVVASLAQPQPVGIEAAPSEEYLRHEVDYSGPERPGTIVIDTPNKFLFLVLPQGRAIRYGVGVGRPGFEWSGVKTITRKAEWPDWTPPPEMMLRRPDLPSHMDGGPENPLGARALYLGSSMYRIHGTNEPTTIGQNVSSGCIRMMNEDVIDLYERVRVGTKVIVM